MIRALTIGVISATAVFLLAPAPAIARDSREAIAARPELFSPETGLRIARYRGPTPDDIPLATRIDAAQARDLIAAGAAAIDVMAAAQSRYDELDGTWLVRAPRQSLPGAVWSPEVGRGTLSDEMTRYFADTLNRLTNGDRSRPIVVFCIADCWMGWNAAQRAARRGYDHVYWLRDGTDGWLDAGWPLEPAAPIPVDVE